MPKEFRLGALALALFAVAFGVSFLFSTLERDVEIVDQDYVKAHVNQPGFILVDTRPESVFNGQAPFRGIPGGHIPGAINFPASDLNILGAAAALAKSGITKKSTIIVYCSTGRSSSQFAETLVKDFYFSTDKVKNYKGGVSDWIKNRNNALESYNQE